MVFFFRFDIPFARNDVLEVIPLPHRARLARMNDQVIGVGQRFSRHGEVQKVVPAGTLVKIDDLVFAIVVHNAIIPPQKKSVNAKKLRK